jgi:predicted transposase YdaD
VSPTTIDHFIDKYHRIWTHVLTKITREHIGSFMDDLLLLLVEETLWKLKICKWRYDSPFGARAGYVWTEAFWLRNASAVAVLPPIRLLLQCFTNSAAG